MMKVGRVICLILCFMTLVSGGLYAFFIHSGYEKGRKEYASIAEEFTSLTAETEDKGENKEIPATEESKPASQPQKSIQKDMKNIREALVNEPPMDAPECLKIDWKGLLEKNEDIVGWISIPAVEISYPVVQTDDNEYYLHRGIDKEYLYAGCIFMDANSSPSLMGYNAIIYGHNMRDGSMFARLKDFQSEETFRKCSYFWIITPSSDNLYEICSIHQASSGSDSFTLRFRDHETYVKWLNKMSGLTILKTGVDISSGDRIVTLSTCTQEQEVRMLVQGKLIYRKER